MKKVLLATGLLLLMSVAGYSQADCKRHVETAGGFSYCPPEGWTSTLDNKKRFQKFSAPRPTLANFNLKEEESSEPLVTYVDLSIETLSTASPGSPEVTLLSRSDFVTSAKLKGVRLVFGTTLQGHQLHFISYIFSGKGRKVVLAGTMLASDSATLKVVEEVARSFRLER